MIKAEIITIGDELLIGQVIDTNSAWMAQQLNGIGVEVKQITSVSDDAEHIVEALNLAKSRAQLVLITGGLGPTKDDITKKTLAQYFQMELVMNADVLAHVTHFFEKRNRPMLDINRQQALVPLGCEVLPNQHGTAPGMWFEQMNCIWVSMPGVPFEMKSLMENSVLPKIEEQFSLTKILHHTILTAGLGESFLAKEIEDIENQLPTHIKLAYLPSLGTLRLRLTARGTQESELQVQLRTHAQAITQKIEKYVIAQEDISLETAIMRVLEQRNQTFTTAESCTGGYIAHLITRHPGSSKTYLGGVVAYSNQLKISLLHVDAQIIENHGAVSEEVVVEMATGALQKLGSDYSMAISGVAGPDGGTETKPVGMVCIAVACPQKTVVKTFQFGYQRMQNIELAAANALYMLWKMMHEAS